MALTVRGGGCGAGGRGCQVRASARVRALWLAGGVQMSAPELARATITKAFPHAVYAATFNFDALASNSETGDAGMLYVK